MNSGDKIKLTKSTGKAKKVNKNGEARVNKPVEVRESNNMSNEAQAAKPVVSMTAEQLELFQRFMEFSKSCPSIPPSKPAQIEEIKTTNTTTSKAKDSNERTYLIWDEYTEKELVEGRLKKYAFYFENNADNYRRNFGWKKILTGIAKIKPELQLDLENRDHQLKIKNKYDKLLDKYKKRLSAKERTGGGSLEPWGLEELFDSLLTNKRNVFPEMILIVGNGILAETTNLTRNQTVEVLSDMSDGDQLPVPHYDSPSERKYNDERDGDGEEEGKELLQNKSNNLSTNTPNIKKRKTDTSTTNKYTPKSRRQNTHQSNIDSLGDRMNATVIQATEMFHRSIAETLRPLTQALNAYLDRSFHHSVLSASNSLQEYPELYSQQGHP
jgi:hypothetical protein